ncbi:MAG: PEP-CTERM sorting domain-containing protein [Planctomycetota bacterium]
MKSIAPTLLLAGLAGTTVSAQVVIDGVVDASYGTPIAVQTVQTQFGDVTDPLLPNGSELNAAFAQFDDDNLYLTFTGNLEPNFNKLIVFFDSVAGGSQSIDPLNNPVNFDSQIGNGNANAWEALDGDPGDPLAEPDPIPPTTGLTFDDGFLPDYAMIFRRGGDKFDFDYAQMNQTAIPADEFVDIYGGFNSGAPFLDLIGENHTFAVGHDDSNLAGVAGGTQAADQAAAAAVTTGTEVQIPLAALGDPTGDIKVSAFISSGSFDFLSNQFLSGLELEDFDNDPETPDDRGNVGGFYDFRDDTGLPGEQFFTISLGDASGIVGDYNESGTVEQGDLNLVLTNWGTDRTFEDPGGTEFSSLLVDQEELNLVLGNWGSTGPAPSFEGFAVPEPGALALLSGLAVAGLRRRRSA